MSTLKELLPKNKLNYIDRNILHYLYTNPRLCDIEFIVNDKRFPANRCVMSAASEVFEAMPFGTFQESSSSDIKISDVVHTESFSSLLSYIYDSGIQVDSLSAEVVLEVLKLGHCYRLPKLCKALENYVSNLDLETTSEYCFGTNAFMELLNVAFIYKIVELYDKMKIVIKSSPENVNTFLEHPKLVDIKCPILVDIFEADNFCTEEVNSLGAVMKWIDANVIETDCSSVSMDTKDNATTSEEHILESCISGSNVSCENPPKKKRKKDALVGESLSSNLGMNLSSHISQLLKNTDNSENNKASGSCTIDTDEMETNDESSKNAPLMNDGDTDPKPDCGEPNTKTDVERLLQTIRSAKLTLFEVSNFRKNNPLCRKYEDILAPIINCSEYSNCKPRKSYIGTKIQLKCVGFSINNYRQYKKYSDAVICQNLKIRFGVDSSYISALYVEDLKCKCSVAPVLFNYSFHLKSLNPFKNNFVLEKKESACFNMSFSMTSSCQHGKYFKAVPTPMGFSFQCAPAKPRVSLDCYSDCGYFCKPEALLANVTWPDRSIFINQPDYVENETFYLEAYIEFVQ